MEADGASGSVALWDSSINTTHAENARHMRVVPAVVGRKTRKNSCDVVPALRSLTHIYLFIRHIPTYQDQGL